MTSGSVRPGESDPIPLYARAHPPAMAAMDYFIKDRTPMGRPGHDGELDSTVIYLAADESTYVTGNICCCDGGWTAI